MAAGYFFSVSDLNQIREARVSSNAKAEKSLSGSCRNWIKSLSLLVVVLFAGIVFFQYFTSNILIEYKAVDEDFRVVVYGKRNLFYPILDGVAVGVEVTQNREILFQDTIDHCDRWADALTQYRQIQVSGEKIRIGPEYWNGSVFTDYFVDSRSLGRGVR